MVGFKLSNKEFFIDIFVANILILCCLLYKSEIFSVISFILFVIYIAYLIYLKSLYFIKYFAFIFGAIIAINGTAIIEFISDLYLVKLHCYSNFVGSLPLHILSYWSLLIGFKYYDYYNGIELTINLLSQIYNNVNTRYLKKVNFFVLLIYLGLFLQVIFNPAFLLGIDRFTYAQIFTMSPFWLKLDHVSHILLIIPILLIIKEKYKIAYLTLLFYIFYYIWNGNKFGPFFNLFYIWILLYYPVLLNKDLIYIREKLNKILKISIAIFCLTLLIVSTNVNNLENYILNRSSQQGQLWWKTFDIIDGNIYFDEIDGEIMAMIYAESDISKNIGSRHGIYKIMYLTAPVNIIDTKLSTGSRYTEAGYASLYYYFGCVGVVFASVMISMIISFTINKFLKSVIEGDYIASFILLRIIFLERTFLSMFLLNDLFKPISLLSYAYLILMNNKKFQVSFDQNIKLKIKRYELY